MPVGTPSRMSTPGAAQRPRIRGAKSRYEDLRELFQRAVTVRYIAGFELVTCQWDEDAAAAGARMEESGFDMLPVVTDGEIRGYVERETLRPGLCASSESRLAPPDLVADSTPILNLLPILEERLRVFVLQDNRVTGVVSRSDLQKAPVRMPLFALFTLLETHLERLVRLVYPGSEWTSQLSTARVRLAEQLCSERQQRHEAIDLTDCLQFCDERELVLRACNRFGLLGFPSRSGLERFLVEVEKLRDLLAHGQDLVAGSSWPERIRLVIELQRTVERLEAVSYSQPRTEESATTSP